VYRNRVEVFLLMAQVLEKKIFKRFLKSSSIVVSVIKFIRNAISDGKML